jgi:hypothetical protein
VKNRRNINSEDAYCSGWNVNHTICCAAEKSSGYTHGSNNSNLESSLYEMSKEKNLVNCWKKMCLKKHVYLNRIKFASTLEYYVKWNIKPSWHLSAVGTVKSRWLRGVGRRAGIRDTCVSLEEEGIRGLVRICWRTSAWNTKSRMKNNINKITRTPVVWHSETCLKRSSVLKVICP